MIIIKTTPPRNEHKQAKMSLFQFRFAYRQTKKKYRSSINCFKLLTSGVRVQKEEHFMVIKIMLKAANSSNIGKFQGKYMYVKYSDDGRSGKY